VSSTVRLRPRDPFDGELLELGERIGRLACAQALHVNEA